MITKSSRRTNELTATWLSDATAGLCGLLKLSGVPADADKGLAAADRATSDAVKGARNARFFILVSLLTCLR